MEKTEIDLIINSWNNQHIRIYLELVQAWRRGDEHLECPNPYIYGKVLDKVINMLC